MTLGKLLNLSMPLYSHVLYWDHDGTHMCCGNLKQTSVTGGRVVQNMAGEAGRLQILNLARTECLLCDWLCAGSFTYDLRGVAYLQGEAH